MSLNAALLLVGSELIRGGTSGSVDENRQFLADELRTVGVNIASVHVVRDDVDSIADLVRFLSSRVAYVITAGGLGPTLDDVTLEAVARAFGLPLVTKEPLDPTDYARMSGSETIQPQLRHVPDGAEVISTAHGPVVRTGNVYSLPGLPRLVKARFSAILGHFGSGAIQAYTLTVAMPQSRVASALERARERYPSVSIGCHPSSDPLDGTTLLFEGRDADELNGCLTFVKLSLNARDETKA